MQKYNIIAITVCMVEHFNDKATSAVQTNVCMAEQFRSWSKNAISHQQRKQVLPVSKASEHLAQDHVTDKDACRKIQAATGEDHGQEKETNIVSRSSGLANMIL